MSKALFFITDVIVQYLYKDRYPMGFAFMAEEGHMKLDDVLLSIIEDLKQFMIFSEALFAYLCDIISQAIHNLD